MQYNNLHYIHACTVSLLYVDLVRKLFVTIRFSEKGSNDRIKEEATYMMFIEYLELIEEGIYFNYNCDMTVYINCAY